MSTLRGVSHHFITRGIKKQYGWRNFLWILLSSKHLDNGYLIIDETDVDKSYAKVIEGLGWIFSHRKNKSIFGYHLVVLAWTNGEVTIPITWRVYKKGGKTKPDLGYELVRFAYYRLGIRPKAYLFDSLYASAKILKFLDTRNQIFHTQIPKNRILDGRQLKYHNKGRPRWTEVGKIKGGLEVQVIRNLKKYFITNDIGISRKEQLDTYSIRWRIEEIFRFVKSQLGLEKCECRSLRSQNNHFGMCFVLFGILQVVSEKTQVSMYQIKQRATQDVKFLDQLDLEGYLMGA